MISCVVFSFTLYVFPWDWPRRHIRGPGQQVDTIPDESLACREKVENDLKSIDKFFHKDEARVLAIHGMPGVGKTTLLEKFNNRLVRSFDRRMFCHIIYIKVSWVFENINIEEHIEVSPSPNSQKIKEDIEEQIGGNLSSLRKSRFLLMLDDVRKEVDLQSMGIPLPSSENRCKVIMTGRKKSHCRIRYVNDGIEFLHVSTLGKLDALNFLKNIFKEGFDTESGEITRLVESVAIKSGGFPRVLQTVSESVPDASSTHLWNDILEKLSEYPIRIENLDREVLHLLQHGILGPGHMVGTLPPYESLANLEQIHVYLRKMEEFIDNDKAKVLGIYGMGGVGKTTLLRIFNNKINDSNAKKRFDDVSFITMSQVMDVNQIRDEVTNLSSLSKKRLLFLDNVGQKLDLQYSEIPMNRSKIIMTGRLKEYFCVEDVNSTDNTQLFKVSILTEEEAWIFFKRTICQDLDFEGEENHAKSMMRKCHGLPLALEIVGHKMIDATVDRWRSDIEDLCRSLSTRRDGEDMVWHLVKFSFDRLNDVNIKNCLLYCCLFKEDKEIPKQELIHDWFGEGFLDSDEPPRLDDEAQNRGHENIRTLVSCKLLQEASNRDDHVMIHDVVRETCGWLTSGLFDEEYGNFDSSHEGDCTSSKWLLRNTYRLLMRSNRDRVQTTFESQFIPGPNLETLLCEHFVITEGLFHDCTSLRVLKLKHCVLAFPPEDLRLLQNLRFLDLSNSKPEDFINEINSLPFLQIRQGIEV